MERKSSDIVIHLYIDLEERLINFIKHIPFNEENKSIVLPLLSNIIVEAGSLIDTIFREECEQLSKPKDELNIVDFALYFEKKYSFSNKKSILFIYPPSYIIPFSDWFDSTTGNYKPFIWWQNYNKLKHNRVENIACSTLETAIKAVCALHQVISQFPTFFESLFRYDLISYGGFEIKYLKECLYSSDDKITVLIESKLFATPNGYQSFPEKPDDIRAITFGQSKKLAHFLGRQLGVND